MAQDGVELIRRMARGDQDAFAAFYDAYAALAFGFIRRIVVDPDEAADVLQEVFWELWRSARSYDPARGSPEAWVTVRARSRGIDRVRSSRRREEMFAVTDVPDERAENPGARVEDRESVVGALRELPDTQRIVIELAYLKGLTQTEIATRLAQPLGTVKTRMRLGMERLRDLMGTPR